MWYRCKHCSAVSRRGFHWPMVLFPKIIRISHHFVQFWVYHYSMSMTRYWKNVLLWNVKKPCGFPRGGGGRGGPAAAQPAACSAVLLLLASLSKPPELEPRPSSSASEAGSCVIELGGSSEEWEEVFVGVEESRRGWGRFFSFVEARNWHTGPALRRHQTKLACETAGTEE